MKTEPVVCIAALLNSTFFSLFIGGILPPLSDDPRYGELETWAVCMAVHLLIGLLIIVVPGKFHLPMKFYPLLMVPFSITLVFVNEIKHSDFIIVGLNLVALTMSALSLGKAHKLHRI
jgi:hypothetical protein